MKELRLSSKVEVLFPEIVEIMGSIELRGLYCKKCGKVGYIEYEDTKVVDTYKICSCDGKTKNHFIFYSKMQVKDPEDQPPRDIKIQPLKPSQKR